MQHLIIANLIFYLNNFLLIILINRFALKGLLGLWFFTPFIFILFTTHVLEQSKHQITREIRALSIIDLVIRAIVLVINFIVISELINLNLNYLLIINSVFLMINMSGEWTIRKKIQLNQLTDEEPLPRHIMNLILRDYASKQMILKNKTIEQQTEIKKSFSLAALVGYSNVLIVFLIVGGIFSFAVFGKVYRLITLIVALLTMLFYLHLVDRKLLLFFEDTVKSKKINYRDNVTLIIAISIIYYLQGFVHIGTGTFNFLGIFFALMFCFPTFITNKQIINSFKVVIKKYNEMS